MPAAQSFFETEARDLIKWFKKNFRALPWRNEPRDPYAVWVSEIMLQQTRASVVVPYYRRWMRRFPNAQVLASAPLEEVIMLWEGLGYYARARNLHEGARYIVEHYGGQLPSEESELKKIRGLGPYTIGAIRSFAFKEKAAAVDGNTIRVLSRFHGIQEDVSKEKVLKAIRQLALENTPEQEHWLYAEALIELGATLCAPKPNCAFCPLQKNCRAYNQNTINQIPYKAKKTAVSNIYRTVAVILHNDRLLIRKGKPGEIMQDLHEFPYLKSSQDGRDALLDEISEYLSAKLGLRPEPLTSLPSVKHTFTRFRAQLTPFLFVLERQSAFDDFFWVSLNQLSSIPFSSGHKKIAAQLKENSDLWRLH